MRHRDRWFGAGAVDGELFPLVADQKREQVFVGGGMRPDQSPFDERKLSVRDFCLHLYWFPIPRVIVIRLLAGFLQLNKYLRHRLQFLRYRWGGSAPPAP